MRIFLSLELQRVCVCVCTRYELSTCKDYVWLFMSVNVSVFVNVSEFGHWVCGESWHATKDL